MLGVFPVPQQVIAGCENERFAQGHLLLFERDVGDEVLASENFVEKAADQMDVFVTNLDEDASAFGQESAHDREAVAQVAEIRMDS